MDMVYFMNQNKKKEATKQKERDDKAKLKDVNMAAPSFDRKILNDQHQREKDAKAKERAQPKENAKFDMAVSEIALRKARVKLIVYDLCLDDIPPQPRFIAEY
eukprot:jgi/Psemu1/6246/gm1.6246_g